MSTQTEKTPVRVVPRQFFRDAARHHERTTQPLRRCLIVMGVFRDVKQTKGPKSFAYWELA
jgi:hypothetical protein